MTTYRLYRLDGRRQILGPPEYFETADDAHALLHAQSWTHPHLMEIWTGQRFVGLATGAAALGPVISDSGRDTGVRGAGE